MLEDGTEISSKFDGIHYIPFSAGNIPETFADGLGMIRRASAAPLLFKGDRA